MRFGARVERQGEVGGEAGGGGGQMDGFVVLYPGARGAHGDVAGGGGIGAGESELRDGAVAREEIEGEGGGLAGHGGGRQEQEEQQQVERHRVPRSTARVGRLSILRRLLALLLTLARRA